MKKILKKSIYTLSTLFLFAFVLACEEDFRDINSGVIGNTKFEINTYDIEVALENNPLETVQTDNITTQINEVLLGVLNSPDYEKLEASFVSQLAYVAGLKVVDQEYGADTTVVTKIDTAFIKLPYQVNANSDGTFSLSSLAGDAESPINLSVYRLNTYINEFNPTDPTKRNSYQSNFEFEKVNGDDLAVNYQFTPDVELDTLLVKRFLFDDAIAKVDTVVYAPNTSAQPIPFARIPLDKNKIKELFLDKYESTEFSSEDEFDNYLRGIIIEASGNQGSLLSYSFNANSLSVSPSIEIFYTNTVLKGGTEVIDTISKINTFPLSGYRVNTYKMDNRTYPVNNEVKIQGTAGSEGLVNLLTQEKIDELRSKNWLINDASLSFYINQEADTSNLPTRLYLYKTFNVNTDSEINSQIKDAITEASFDGIGGFLERDENGKAEKYTFKITDYISDVVNGDINYLPKFKLKVFNPTDNPQSATDTIFNNFSWSANAITLFSNLNSSKKPVLKISYSQVK